MLMLFRISHSFILSYILAIFREFPAVSDVPASDFDPVLSRHRSVIIYDKISPEAAGRPAGRARRPCTAPQVNSGRRVFGELIFFTAAPQCVRACSNSIASICCRRSIALCD